jgi:hypothetical protein
MFKFILELFQWLIADVLFMFAGIAVLVGINILFFGTSLSLTIKMTVSIFIVSLVLIWGIIRARRAQQRKSEN